MWSFDSRKSECGSSMHLDEMLVSQQSRLVYEHEPRTDQETLAGTKRRRRGQHMESVRLGTINWLTLLMLIAN